MGMPRNRTSQLDVIARGFSRLRSALESTLKICSASATVFASTESCADDLLRVPFEVNLGQSKLLIDRLEGKPAADARNKAVCRSGKSIEIDAELRIGQGFRRQSEFFKQRRLKAAAQVDWRRGPVPILCAELIEELPEIDVAKVDLRRVNAKRLDMEVRSSGGRPRRDQRRAELN